MITDDELNALLAPSEQVYTGKPDNPDPISRELALMGQTNPIVLREQAVQNGRFLSGLGDASMSSARDEEAQFSDHADVMHMEEQDDVLGSGIFDMHHRPATVNAQMGVFEARYSIPGPHAREVPFHINHEITDVANGAAVVGIPSGGLNFVEHGKAIGYLDSTNRFEPYADTGVGGKSWDADSTLAPAERLMAPSDPRGGKPIPFVQDPKKAARQAGRMRGLVPGRPARDPQYSVREVGSAPASHQAGMRPHLERMPSTPTVYAKQHSIPGLDPGSVPAFEYLPPRAPVMAPVVPVMAPIPAAQPAAPVQGFGSGEMGAGTWIALLGAGVAAGVAFRMFFPPKK